MQRSWTVVVAMTLGMLTAGAVRGETCSPASCAGMSPLCWKAYQVIMVNKESKFASVDDCRAAARDLEGAGSWLAAKGLTPTAALCACDAAFWSLDSNAQGLPDLLDNSQENDNDADAY
jgi:hypothetical protein